MKTYRYVKLDPTGNITCLVLDPADHGDEKTLTRKLLKECEQVAYLEKPSLPGAVAAIRLMAVNSAATRPWRPEPGWSGMNWRRETKCPS